MKPAWSSNKSTFERLAKKGLSCKQIAKRMGWHPGYFGYRMKEILGIYPSIYIARMKNGKT